MPHAGARTGRDVGGSAAGSAGRRRAPEDGGGGRGAARGAQAHCPRRGGGGGAQAQCPRRRPEASEAAAGCARRVGRATGSSGRGPPPPLGGFPLPPFHVSPSGTRRARRLLGPPEPEAAAAPGGRALGRTLQSPLQTRPRGLGMTSRRPFRRHPRRLPERSDVTGAVSLRKLRRGWRLEGGSRGTAQAEEVLWREDRGRRVRARPAPTSGLWPPRDPGRGDCAGPGPQCPSVSMCGAVRTIA